MKEGEKVFVVQNAKLHTLRLTNGLSIVEGVIHSIVKDEVVVEIATKDGSFLIPYNTSNIVTGIQSLLETVQDKFSKSTNIKPEEENTNPIEE